MREWYLKYKKFSKLTVKQNKTQQKKIQLENGQKTQTGISSEAYMEQIYIQKDVQPSLAVREMELKM